MNQQTTGTNRILQDLLTLRIGEQIVYGYVNRQGSSNVDPAVTTLVRTLEHDDKIIRFMRKTRMHADDELVAVGTTRDLNERIVNIIKWYEAKHDLPKTMIRKRL